MKRYPTIEVKESCGGLGVFAVDAIAAGTAVMEFVGERFERAAVECAAAAGGSDGFLQAGLDTFVGLSGSADDFVNHSCRPNCYIQFRGEDIFLIALTAIAAGEELFFDYGVTQVDFPFRFECVCGSAECRGEIGNFDEIPLARLRYYRTHGAVPAHVEALLAPAAVVRSSR